MPVVNTRIAIWAAAVLLGLTVPCVGADFFVASDGNEANPGTEQKPFASIGRARDAVRQKIAAGLTADLTVSIAEGTYRITQPIAFGPADGGTDGFSVTYAAAEGDRPVLSGGRVLTGWKQDGDGNWTVELPEVRARDWTFRELFVGGRRSPRARHPNRGFFRVEQIGKDRRTNFRYAEGDLRAYGDVANIELVFLHDWSITRVPLKSIDPQSRTLTVQHQVGGPGRWTPMDWFEKQPRYYLESARELLDAPGEWFLDHKTGRLTYRPRPGEEFGQVEIIAPVARQLLVVRGDPPPGRPVRNLHFKGLSCEHAAWLPSYGVYWGRQACTYWAPKTLEAGRSHEEADPAAVQFDLTETCSFTDGRIAHVGRSGLWFGRGCRNNRVVGTVVADTGGNGIMVGEGQTRKIGDRPWWEAAPEQAAQDNLVANNLVECCGQELFGAVGVWVGLAAGTTVSHNEVCNHPYTGVSIGWMWWDPRTRPQPRKTPCERTLVADNHIHHVMLMLSDGGGIYSLGIQPGSALRGNLIHDVLANVGRAENNGMFLDQGTGRFTIEGNVIYNIARSPLRFHKGWENLVRNNVLEVTPGIPPIRYNDTQEERIELQSNRLLENIPDQLVDDARRRAGPVPEYRNRLFR